MKNLVEELKQEMHSEFGWIGFTMSDTDIEKWLNERKLTDVDKATNLFVDYILANGLQDDIQE